MTSKLFWQLLALLSERTSTPSSGMLRATALTRIASNARSVAHLRAYSSAAEPAKSRLGRKLLGTVLLATTAYSGATYFALKNEAFYDTYTTYVPGGEQILDAIEDATEDKRFKEYAQQASTLRDNVATHASNIKYYARSTKETALDWYEYAGDLIAQLRGEEPPSEKQPSSAGPAPVSRSRRRREETRRLFDNVLTGVEPVSAPSFFTKEPSLQALGQSVQQLAHMLNEAGMTGHAQRLVELSTRDINALDKELCYLRDEQSMVLQQTKSLMTEAATIETQMSSQYDEATSKVKTAMEKAEARVVERTNKLRDTLLAESAALQQELVAQGEESLSSQRRQYLETLAKDLKTQAIETQKQYMKRVQKQVEEERGGRLSKIDELVARQNTAEQLASAGAEYLDEARKAHQLLISIDALKRAVYTSDPSNKRAFLEELQTLLKISTPSSPFDNPAERRTNELVQAVASSISQTVAEHGVDSLAELTDRFAVVSDQVHRASLIPEEGGGLFSHLVSAVLSQFMFRKHGLIQGDDTEARLARAEYYLEKEQELESAAREINQLRGWSKRLASGWLDAARRHLEVKQAIEVMQAQALLTSILQIDK